MSRAFTEYENELIRKRLLEQGYKLFSIYGLKKTSIEEIAKATGISKGTFYKFFDSKEALFLGVIEQAENRIRQRILDVIDLPGPSGRARLFAVLKQAYSLFREIPILQFVTGIDYDLLFRRIPPEKLQEHMANDWAFIEKLVTHCREAGIPILVSPQQVVEMLYPLALSIMHEDDLRNTGFIGNSDLLLELVAAYCLGEVEIKLQEEKNQI